MKTWIVRGILFVVGLELAYLVLVNLALNLPLTQSLISEIRPEKFTIQWRRAWSLYPLKVHVRDISTGGKTSSLQWNVRASEASASLAVWPLLNRTVRVENPSIADLEYHQQRLAKGKKDKASDEQDAVDKKSQAKGGKKKPGWRIVVNGVRATGQHQVSFDQIRAALAGQVGVDVAFQTAGGPLSLGNGAVDLTLDTLELNEDRVVTKQGLVKGSFSLAPFVPKGVKGADVATFLSIDAEVEAEVEDLGFLDFYLVRFSGMRVDGAGKLDSRLRYEKGQLLPQSSMVVSARELSVDLLSHRVEGDGSINMNVGADDPETLNLGIEFGALSAGYPAAPSALFTGQGLAITTRGPARLFPFDRRDPESRYLSVKIPRVSFPDLNAYQRYLPDEWGVRLLGGQGELQGQAELSGARVSGEVTLASSDADVAFREYRFISNLEAGIFIKSRILGDPSVDVSGTYLRLDEARLASEGAEKAPPWKAALTIDKGTLGVRLPEGMGIGADADKPFQAPQPVELKTLLAGADAEFHVNGSISSLEWINLLLPNPYNLSIAGTGEVSANAQLASGKLVEGTRIEVLPEQMAVNFLDYVVKGDGLVSLELEKGGKRPDIKARIEIDDALLGRQGDDEAFIENVAIRLQALGKELTFDGAPENIALDLKISSATIGDMSVYNQYFPKDSPLQILSGEANLTADVHFTPESTGGYVKLRANDLRSRLNEQEISGEFAADINLAGGVPKDMDFDISGSSLLLDKVRVIGEQKSYEQADWSARFDLRKGRAVWRKPVQLEIDAGIEMKDSRPLVAIFSNERGKHGWLSNMLTIEGVHADAQLKLANEELVIPYAFADSDKIGVGIKGIVNKEHREGMFYVRFRKLNGLLKIHNEDRNFDIIGARSQFDEYVPGALKQGAQDSATDAPASDEHLGAALLEMH